MLSIQTSKGYIPLDNRQNFNIVYDYEGGQTLSFDLSPNDPAYQYVSEKTKLKYGDNRYNILKINKRKTIVTIVAELDLNEWRTRVYHTIEFEGSNFKQILDKIIPDDWSFTNIGAAKGTQDITLEGVTDYDVLIAAQKAFNIAFEFHILEKQVNVIDPTVVQQRGLYLSDELNLDSVEYKGEFTTQVNRLYAYGKQTETEQEDGTKLISYVNFASINKGKEYVDCMDYKSDEIVCEYWQDNQYEDPQHLLTDAIERIKIMAFPEQSWSCNIYDLSRINDKYKILDFKLYDKPVLLADGQKIVHQIVEYTEYPDNENLNKVVLSTAFKKIEGEITSIKTDVGELDLDAKVKERLLNEIRRDVNSNTLFIQDTYQKGDIDTKVSTMIQQTEDRLQLVVGSAVEKIQTTETEMENRITETFKSSIDQNRSEIDLSVREVKESVDSSTEQIKGLKTQINLTSEQASIVKTTVEKLQDSMNGKISESQIREWARFNGAELELGASNSPFKAVLSTTELAFWQGTNKVAWISNNEMHIANSIILEILKVGNWVCRDEGSAGLTWRRV